MIEINGHIAPGFEAIGDAFAAAFDGLPRMGGALAIRVDGRSVVDLWAGSADARIHRPWERDTPSVVFSCSKGLMSILVARLAASGQVDLDSPLAALWPEFGQHGKDAVTVGDALAHRAGVPALSRDLTTEDLLDFDRVAALLAAQEPLWKPGQAWAYHALTHGWISGEIVRRASGVAPADAFREMADLLGADAWLGLPAERAGSAAHLFVGATLQGLVAQQAAQRAPGAVDWGDRAMTLGGALPPTLVGEAEGFNTPAVQAAVIPGAGVVATARAVAAMWSATVAETDGVRLIDDDTVVAATRERTAGAPFFDAPAPWPRWGAGFQLDSEARRYLGPSSFGHDGAGGQVAFADLDSRVGFSFVTNWMEAVDDHRATRIVDALREVVA
ncbi:CubicO group peptidase (beta-lactamase class C family) [Microbacterium sp. SORGH_AS428]|uniref:serine hydrolase domain-containing protein n=1 Tax=Microbacterium sp. SORGH_AS_0428 TaxID=3041788 RepID=UPI002856680D|nr:serine hydrolase domain-containing protein [Microbacterium sp. SORGH_AS_0428]MDR6200558.1 CubicO group peptidase (beta-lactamase class C family) [Microbacterium sp. SORGH_AS_0428]